MTIHLNYDPVSCDTWTIYQSRGLDFLRVCEDDKKICRKILDRRPVPLRFNRKKMQNGVMLKEVRANAW